MDSDLIRKHVLERYILPARARGESTVSVTAGDVQKELGLKNRIAWVCTALRAERFQSENQLRLKSESGPPQRSSSRLSSPHWTPHQQIRSGSFAESRRAYLKDPGSGKNPFAKIVKK